MAEIISLPKILSLSKVLTSPRPQELVKEELITLLKNRLKKLDILWNPKSFSGGLSNPELPKKLLNKLENLVSLAELSNWELSSQVKLEIDETIEDIETFNPSFRKSLIKEIKQAKEDLIKGRAISGEEMERKIGLK